MLNHVQINLGTLLTHVNSLPMTKRIWWQHETTCKSPKSRVWHQNFTRLGSEISKLIHTNSNLFNTYLNPNRFPINRGRFYLHLQALKSNKTLQPLKLDTLNNQSSSFFIQAFLLPFLFLNFFIGILWSFLKDFLGMNPLATLLLDPPLLTSEASI